MRFINGLRNRKGSLTVEAAIIMPLFICVILSFAFFMRVVHTHNVMQHALNETANEMASYSYIYSITLQDMHDKAKGYLEEGKKPFNDHLTQAFDSYNALSAKKDSVDSTINNGFQADDVENLKKLIQEGKKDAETFRNIFNDVKNDPKKELISIACVFADGAFEDAKTAVTEPLTRLLIKKHFLKADGISGDEYTKRLNDRLDKLNIVGGFDGLDFSESRIFSDKKCIDIVVRYKVKTILPIKVIPDLYIIQRSTVRAWLNGDGTKLTRAEEKPQSTPQTSVWEKGPAERGKEIQKLEGRNLPDNFPTLTSYDSGKAVMVRSIDLDAPTYLKPSNVKSKVRSFINEFANFKDGTYGDKVIKVTSRTLILVVPEGSITPEVRAVLDECIKYAAEKGITLTIKEAYGRSPQQSEDEAGTVDGGHGTPTPTPTLKPTPTPTPTSTPTPTPKESPSAKGLIGKDFEDFLTKNIGGEGSFSVEGRDFDGGIEINGTKRWWEAKSGQYWDYLNSNPRNVEKFKSDMGHRLKIAKDNGATYELHSNTPIPDNIKEWLRKKGIPFTEWD
ncbi:MAG: pilus assembly protein [Clostridia bacterium]|nr:pilus assembly protein [Clostridia bacterium]